MTVAPFALMEALELQKLDEASAVILLKRMYKFANQKLSPNELFEENAADEQNLLNIMSFLDLDRFQLHIISKGAVGIKIYRAKVALPRSSLVRQNASLRLSRPGDDNGDLRELGMHRLVQAPCHLRMSSPVRRHFFKIAIDLPKRCGPVASRHATYNPEFYFGSLHLACCDQLLRCDISIFPNAKGSLPGLSKIGDGFKDVIRPTSSTMVSQKSFRADASNSFPFSSFPNCQRQKPNLAFQSNPSPGRPSHA